MKKKIILTIILVVLVVLGAGLAVHYDDLFHKHAYEVIEEVEATCTTDGSIKKKCSTCGEEKTETLPACHTKEVVPGYAATCTAEGLTDGSKCATCGKVYVEQETIPALGHDVANGDCSRCAYQDLAVLHPNGYDLVKVQAEENIANSLIYLGEVNAETSCSYIVSTGMLPGNIVNGVSYGAHIGEIFEYDGKYFVNVEPYAAVVFLEGEAYFLVDHAEEVIPGYAATCDKDGLTNGSKCATCDEVYVEQETIPALGHDVVNGECSRCAYQDLAILHPNGYDLVKVQAKENIANSLIYLGEVNAETSCSYIVSTGMLPGNIVNGVSYGAYIGEIFEYDGKYFVNVEPYAAVVFQEGEAYFLVDHTEEVIPGYAATCDKDGLTNGSKCATCGKVYVEQETIPALGHDVVNGECSRCAYQDLAVLYPNGYDLVAVKANENMAGRLLQVGKVGEEYSCSYVASMGTLIPGSIVNGVSYSAVLGEIFEYEGYYYVKADNVVAATLREGTVYFVEAIVIDNLANWTMPASAGYTVDGNELTFAGTNELTEMMPQ